MYILSAQQIQDVISGPGAQSCAVPPQLRFDTLLNSVRTRAEEALNVHSIQKKVWVDHFRVSEADADLERTFRLSNGFLRADKGIIITSTVDGALDVDHEIDRPMGLVYTTLPAGSYKITYMSGFAADQATNVFTDCPDWLQSIAMGVMVQWLRLSNNGSLPKDVSIGSLTEAMRREIATRVYERYMRPRTGCLWIHRAPRELPSNTVLPANEE